VIASSEKTEGRLTIRFQVSKPVLAGRERHYVLDAVDSGWISSTGAYIGAFERAVGRAVGIEDGISVCNGTVALHLACLVLGLRSGQEVIVPSLTYVATANCVTYCGAKPVMADCDPRTWNLTAEAIEPLINSRTAGVIAVHLYGLPCPIAEISELCRQRGLWLIEDCAESLGATVEGRPTGSFGDAATFSFYGNKTISTGEGGMLFLRDPSRRVVARMLRGQGMDPKRRYFHPIVGYNYRMTNVVAAIGLGQVEQLDYHLGERRRIAASYHRGLASIEAEGLVMLPAQLNGFESSCWLFSLVLRGGGPNRRARIMAQLERECGIETRPFFMPMHKLPMYRSDLVLANAEFLGDHGINLPTYSGLTDAEVADISEAICHTVASDVPAECMLRLAR
jgi:perosamine synthetase